MKKVNLKKGSESLKRALNRAESAGKTIASAAKDGAQILSQRAQLLSDKVQKINYESRMKRYNPLFPEQYRDPHFNLPNLIAIVDDAVRKNIDVYEGAIGWINKESGTEVLYLYDEAVAFSGLNFIPAATCDCVYYVDPHNRKQFINVDCYFASMQESKLAELQHIAYSLGARRYWVEMTEYSNERQNSSQRAALNSPQIKTSESHEYEQHAAKQSKSLAEATFSGKREPVAPELCWFAHDNNVKNLIQMRCFEKDTNVIETYNIELSSSNAASMSVNTAIKIDAALKRMGVNGNFNMHSTEEHNRRMFFKLEF